MLISDNLIDRKFISALSIGFDQLERYVRGSDGTPACSPAWAAQICGIPPEDIAHFARAYATTKPAMLFPGLSIQRVFAGEEPYRLSVALQIATRNFGQRGGSTGAFNHSLPAPRVGRLPIPEIAPQPTVPTLRWPEAVLQGRSGSYPSDVHALYNLGSNMLNQGSETRKSIAAFERLEFAVTHEIFLTPTARYCDVVFPTTTTFEKADIGIPWGGNYLLYKQQILPPTGKARSDYEALCDLASRLGFYEEFSEGRSAEQWLQHFLENSEISDPDEFRRTGIYFGPDQERVGLADFARHPQSSPLSTPSGKVEIGERDIQSSDRLPLHSRLAAVA